MGVKAGLLSVFFVRILSFDDKYAVFAYKSDKNYMEPESDSVLLCS